MTDREQALKFKNEGNAAFSARDFDKAIELFTKAIEKDATDHVFFSNRSACYLSKGQSELALQDAEQCVTLAPSWGKGYSRKGAALHALRQFGEAVEAYAKGLEVEPGNAALQEGLQQVQRDLERSQASSANPLAQMFGPQLLAQLAGNPQMSSLLRDESFLAKIRDIQANPDKIMTYLQDPQMMQVLGTMFGAQSGDADEVPMPPGTAGSPPATSPPASASAPPAKPAPAPEPEPEPEREETAEERQAREQRERAEQVKKRGNTHYSRKEFQEALRCYDEAAELDPANMTYPNNRAAVLFEMGDMEGCVAACKKAVEVGRSSRADFVLLAKALARMGNAYMKMEDYDAAIAAFKDSLLENSTPDVVKKVKRATELKEKRDEMAYRDPAKALEAKERGNKLFSEGNFPGAIEEYTDAVKRDPDNATFYCNRAAAFTKVMDFGNAMSDCEHALKLNPKYVKAWSRKASIEFFLKKYHKALDSYKAGLAVDPEDAQCKEGLARTIRQVNLEAASGKVDQERAARAMEDPEIMALRRDPTISAVLQEMNTNPAAASKALADPTMRAKLEKLMAAGVLSFGSGGSEE